jgi:hypothetical protein
MEARLNVNRMGIQTQIINGKQGYKEQINKIPEN